MILFGKFIRIQAVCGKLTRKNVIRIFVDSCLTIASHIKEYIKKQTNIMQIMRDHLSCY